MGSPIGSLTRSPTGSATNRRFFAGGTFASAFDSGDSFLAKWGCPDATPPTIVCPEPVLAIESLGSSPVRPP